MFEHDYWDRPIKPKSKPAVRTTMNKDVPLLTNPHYTDDRFASGKTHTVFGKDPGSDFGHKGLEYVYSDRLWQWDYSKAQEAAEVANESDYVARSCNWYEAYLSHYLDEPVEIHHIVSGVNVSNGYSYFVLGYKTRD